MRWAGTGVRGGGDRPLDAAKDAGTPEGDVPQEAAQVDDSSTLMAPVPPSMRRADVNARTGAVLRRIMFTAVLITGPRGPEFIPLPWMMRTQRRLWASASARKFRSAALASSA